MKESKIILYTTSTGKVSIEVQFEDGSFWLSQKGMAELFGVEVNTINYHLKEIFKTQEVDENSVIRKIRITATDGKNYETNFYNIKIIVLVGYRVNSCEATNFRIWATSVLELSQYPILQDKGKINALEAKLRAEQEFETFRKTQDNYYLSDFDKEIIQQISQ